MMPLVWMAHYLPMRQEAESNELLTALEREWDGSGEEQYHAFVQKEPGWEMVASGFHWKEW